MYSSDHYIPAPHACLLGSYFQTQNHEDGEGNDYVICLWMSGGYLTGDENMVVEDFKKRNLLLTSKELQLRC